MFAGVSLGPREQVGSLVSLTEIFSELKKQSSTHVEKASSEVTKQHFFQHDHAQQESHPHPQPL